MLITVECEKCNQPYSVDEKFLGRRVSCQACGHAFVIATAPPPVTRPSSDPFENAVFETPAAPKPTGRPIHWSNPIETNALAPADEARRNPVPSRIKKGPLARVRDRWVDRTTIYFIIFFVAIILIYGGALSSQIIQSANDSSARNTALMQLWEGTILAEILYFALIAPVVLLAMWGTSKIFNFKVGDGTYLRTCAVCGLAFVVLNVYSAMSPPMLALLVLIAVSLTVLG